MEYRIINAMVEGKLSEIKVRNGKICSSAEVLSAPVLLDAEGAILRPGLIDIHAHGCVGYDTMEGHLSEMSAYEFRNGITTWLPTTMTMPISDIRRVTAAIPERGKDEAVIAGFHMEGPYICEEYKGAQNKEYLALPDVDAVREMRNVKLVTIAPELKGSMEFIRDCGIAVSLGHSAADYETAAEAFRCGARCLTHTFNAMSPFHHREPGLIGAALTEGGYAQVISDGTHLHRAVVLALYRMFGPERMILISDSIRATGVDDGDYLFGGQRIRVRDGVARTETGALAGSTSTLYDCVRTAVSFGIPEEDAYRMASRTPAEMMGWKKGRLLPGYDAEFILTDQSGALLKTMILD